MKRLRATFKVREFSRLHANIYTLTSANSVLAVESLPSTVAIFIFFSLSFFFFFFLLFLTAFAFCGRFFFGFCRREISRRDESILAGESRVQFVSVLPLYSFCYCNQKIVDHAVNAARRGWLTLLVVSNGFMICLNISFFFFYFYRGLFYIIFRSFPFPPNYL